MAQPTPCPYCATPLPANTFYCRHCKRNLPVQPAPAGDLFCMACGTVGRGRKHTKGSFGMEVLLWLLLIVPGIIYSFWRVSSRARVCGHCGAPNMIPVGSPVARAEMARLTASGTHGVGHT